MKKNLFKLSFLLCAFSVLISCENNEALNKKVLIILKAENQFWELVEDGFDKAEDEFDVDYDLFYVDFDTDWQSQKEILEECDLSNYDGVIIAPAVPAELESVISTTSAQLPVVIIDTEMPADFDDYNMYVGMDNCAAGEQVYNNYVNALSLDTIYAFSVVGNTSIESRVRGFSSLAAADGVEMIVHNLNGNDIEAQIDSIYLQLQNAGGTYFFFSAFSMATVELIDLMEDDNILSGLAVIDKSDDVMDAYNDDLIQAVLAQPAVGYGYESVKSLVKDNFPTKINYLEPEFMCKGE